MSRITPTGLFRTTVNRRRFQDVRWSGGSENDRFNRPQKTPTLYAVVLFKGFVASRLSIRNEKWDCGDRVEVGRTPSACVIYHAIFYGADACRVEARLEHNPDASMKTLRISEVVEGTKTFQTPRTAGTSQLSSVDFWFKLITLGGKLFDIKHF
jgi:hypothetical protein